MPLKAALFDVGDTLVEHWAPKATVNERARARIRAALGELEWLDALLEADIEPVWPGSLARALAERAAAGQRLEPEASRQETERWYRAWFDERGIALDGIDLGRLRSLMCVPLDEISTPVAGAADAVRWCMERGLRVVLVTNTLSRGDEEVVEDWRRFGVDAAIHGVVSSHSAGWRKPHPAIFDRALAIADARPEEAFHVGDNLICDVVGAQQLGIRAIWRRSPQHRGPAADRTAAEAAVCGHPSGQLFLLRDGVSCRQCGGSAGVDVRPDATIDELTELPAVVSRWLARGDR